MKPPISPPPRHYQRLWAWARTEPTLLAALLAFLVMVWALLALTDEVGEGDFDRFDQRLLLAFRMPGDLSDPIGPRWLEEAARDITALGGFTLLSLITLISFTALMILGRRRQAWIFGLTVLAAQICSQVFKALIDRPRPDLVAHHDLVYSASFPSGHATMAPVVFLTLAAILAASDHHRSLKICALSVGLILTILVGVSRVYLGVHWPTDVLAGWTLGAGIALCASVILLRGRGRKIRL